MTYFNPENSFNEIALSLLEAAAGIPLMNTLSDYTQRLQDILGLGTTPNLDLKSLLYRHIPPTWKSLLLIIRQLNLGDLAQQMESYLSGAVEDPCHHKEKEMVKVEEGERSTVMNNIQ